MGELGIFDAIYSARALRRLKPDPVPEELITKVLVSEDGEKYGYFDIGIILAVANIVVLRYLARFKRKPQQERDRD